MKWMRLSSLFFFLPWIVGFGFTTTFWDNGKTRSLDPCAGKAVGEACGGGIYAGAFSDMYTGKNRSMIAMPGGCNANVVTPICDGSTDVLTLQWASAGGSYGGNDVVDGKGNTVVQASKANNVAAKFCASLNYGGYNDWFLPALNELQFLYSSKSGIGGFKLSSYWTSTQGASGYAQSVSMSNNSVIAADTMTNARYVRCVRYYYPP